MKKVLSVIISFIIVCVFAVPAVAYSDSTHTYTVSFKTNTSDPRVKTYEPLKLQGKIPQTEIPEGPSRPGYVFKEWNTSAEGKGFGIEPGETMIFFCNTTFYAIWEKNENSPVAIMYLFATTESITEHFGMYFENISDENIQIGHLTLKPGQTTSLGSLNSSINNVDHKSYNSEVFMAKKNVPVIALAVAIKEEMTQEELNTVSDRINGVNLCNYFTHKCENFLIDVWNSVSPEKIAYFCFPVITIIELVLHGGKIGVIKMDNQGNFRMLQTG